MTRRAGDVVWEPDGRGWRPIRARIPVRPRSGHASAPWVPRPPSYRFTAAGVEDARRPELEQLGALVARELAREAVDRLGGWALALAVGFAWLKGTRK